MTTTTIATPAQYLGVAIILGCAIGVGYLAGRGRTIRHHQTAIAAAEQAAVAATIGYLVDVARQHHQALGRLQDDIDEIAARRRLTRPAPTHRVIEAAARTTEHRAITTGTTTPTPLRRRIEVGDPALDWTRDQPIKVARTATGTSR